MEELLKVIIGAAVALVAAAITALRNLIKSKLSAKTRAKVEEIAAVVEQLYNGCDSADKLAAFKELCSAKGLNVGNAVKYLERYIIPLSKKINRYEVTESVKHDDTEVTN